MTTIVVGGSSSNSGKTVFSTRLIKYIKSRMLNVCAVKVTVLRVEGVCPRGKNCGVCTTFSEDYLISDKDIVIRQEGKDTNTLYEAGADKVMWLRCKSFCLEKALKELLGKCSAYDVLLLEGNTVIKGIRPDYSFMVIGSEKKQSFYETRDKFKTLVYDVDEFQFDKELDLK